MAVPMATSDAELLSNFHHLRLDRRSEDDDEDTSGNTVPLSSSAGAEVEDRSDWVIAIRNSEYTTNRHRRHSHYPFETKKLLQSLQQSSTNRCTKSKSRIAERKSSGTTPTAPFTLRPSKLILKKTTSSFVSTALGRRARQQIRKSLLDSIPEELPPSAALSEPTVPPLQQSCSQQATSGSELNINELASYFDLYCEIPRKMSPMAEMMYT